MDIFEKCYQRYIQDEVREQGVYPYFRALESRQDTEVIMEGKRRIMLGSNNYLGLTTNDAVVKAGLWRSRITFRHGTGHGIGYVLNVHEGPGKIIIEYASLFPYARQTALLPGMLFSDEPGVYKPGRHGIRIENSVFVQEEEKRMSDIPHYTLGVGTPGISLIVGPVIYYSSSSSHGYRKDKNNYSR